MLLLALAGSLVGTPVHAQAPSEYGLLLGRVDHVTDGDTLHVRVAQTRYRIRLHEIDAPEHDQPGSRAAREALAGKVDGKYVRVTMHTIDDYGRIVGQVWLGDRNINREMVREGHAWAYRQYLVDQTLLDDEAAAREAGYGLWQQAEPVPPWHWRQGQRGRPGARDRHLAAGRHEPTDDCRIKGNINRRGERIYHRPGDRDYARTRIDPAQGERWFCSPAQAEQAGWRPAR